MYRRTYDGSGFSPLQQIDTNNVGTLSLAWSLSTDLVEAHETTPIVNHGRMFITTPGNNVIALDAKTGTQLWRYVKKYPDDLFQLHPTNRGVALYGNRVYMATTDCQLVALDAATGKEDWSVEIHDYRPAATRHWPRSLREARSSLGTPVRIRRSWLVECVRCPDRHANLAYLPTQYQRPMSQAGLHGKATHTSAAAARSGSPMCLIPQNS
jgi:hypothetical protein